MKEKSIFPHPHWVSCIDGLMLIVKKLGQLIDQKDERIKEMEKQLLKYEEKERHNTKQGKADA